MKKLILVFILGLTVSLSYAQVKIQSQPQNLQPAKSNRTAIKLTDLPKPITDSIAKNYTGYKTVEAFQINNKSANTYEVLVAKDANKMQLYYDKDGKFLRKALQPVKPANTSTTQPKTTSTTTTTTTPKVGNSQQK